MPVHECYYKSLRENWFHALLIQPKLQKAVHQAPNTTSHAAAPPSGASPPQAGIMALLLLVPSKEDKEISPLSASVSIVEVLGTGWPAPWPAISISVSLSTLGLLVEDMVNKMAMLT